MYNNEAILNVISHLKKRQAEVYQHGDNQRKARFGFNTHGNVIPIPNPGGRNVTIIAALDKEDGIGKNNGIPWKLSPDMQQFKRLTTGHHIVMGRKTFESLGSKPLPDRINVVITRDIGKFYNALAGEYQETVVAIPSLDLAVDAIEQVHDEQIFIIGGGQIYQEAMDQDLADDMILTRLIHKAGCDTFFPAFDKRRWLPPVFSTHDLSGGVSMRYEYWRRIKPETPPLKE